MPNLNAIFQPLAAPADIATWDAAAVRNYALPVAMLMENAGRAAFYLLKSLIPLQASMRVLVLAGGGNNGGDGLVLARYLHNAGCRVTVRCLKASGSYRGPARQHLLATRKAGVFIERLRHPDDAVRWRGHGRAQHPVDQSNATEIRGEALQRMDVARKEEIHAHTLDGASSFARAGALPPPGLETPPAFFTLARHEASSNVFSDAPDIIVDALFGSGFHAPLREDAVGIIRAINAQRGVFVFALDIPSGLNALNGTPEPEAVRASATVTFAAPKPGLVLPWGSTYAGVLRLAEIGLPRQLMQSVPAAFRLIAPHGDVLDPPPATAHKGEKGHVLIVGGSEAFTGAPALTAIGALRSGAGLVTVAAPHALCPGIKGMHPEIMTHPLRAQEDYIPDDGTQWTEALIPPLLTLLKDFAGRGGRRAIVLGPGLGRSAGAQHIARAVVEHISRHPDFPPLLVDADGLFSLRIGDNTTNQCLNAAVLRASDVITPHPGEMMRLLSSGTGVPTAFTSFDDRTAVLHDACAHMQATILLKGAGTLVAQGNSPPALAPFAEPNLGIGGSGDILSGVIGALLAAGLPALEAAALGAHLHGRAGQISRQSFPAGGALASDIAAGLPRAMRELYWTGE